MTNLKDLFLAPERAYRPWTYWWWPGNSVTLRTLESEMDMMIASGLGGAVIVPVYQIDEDREAVRAFSPEWNGLIESTLKAAKERDFLIWLNMGGARLPGGPYIDEELACHRLAARSQRLRGPKRIDADIWVYAAKMHQSQLGKDVAPYLHVDSIHLLHRDERNRVRERIFLDNPPNRGIRWIWSLEKGIFDLIVCFRYPTGQQVEHASPGWSGFVLDPYNRSATQLFIDNTIEAFGDTGKQYADSVFKGWYLEGFEAPGANYTGDLYEIFEARRGYDLRRRLPDLWDNLDKDSEGVRQDMLRTLSELQTERFYVPVFEAIEKRGLQFLLQPQGASSDVMALAARANVPMGESIGPRTYEKYIDARGRRFISSSAFHHDKKPIPAECYTKLHQSRYSISLELMKASTDTVFLGGINHVVNHGLTYSPEELDTPWAYCEPSLIGPQQTWWKYYPHFSDYVTRLSGLFQNARPVHDVLMYAPMADSFARTLESIPLKRGLDNTWGQELTSEPGIDTGAAMGRHTLPCADPIDEAGYRFDYINGETLLNKGRCVDGRYEVNGFRYQILVFHRVGYLPLKILRKLYQLIQEGCILVAVGRTPMGLFGKAETEANQKEFDQIMDNLYPKGKGKSKSRVVGKGMVYEVETPVDLVQLLEERVTPDVVVNPLDANFGFCHYQENDREIYFMANCSQKTRSLELGLRHPNSYCELWDPITGTAQEWARAWHQDGRQWVALDFGPFQSYVVVLDPNRKPSWQVSDTNFARLVIEDGKMYGLTTLVTAWLVSDEQRQEFVVPDAPGHFRVPGPWMLKFPDPLNKTFEEPKLRCWTKSPKTRHFSGIATYQTTFDYDGPIKDVLFEIDLGRVHEVASVRLNGVDVGVSWVPPRTLDIPSGVLISGENFLEVEVCNLGHNSHLLDPPETRNTRPDYGQTRAVRGVKKEEPLPSGLHGPVRIRCMMRVPIPTPSE